MTDEAAGMDRKITSTSLSTRQKFALIGSLFILIIVISGYFAANQQQSLKVEREKLQFAEVKEDLFREFIRVSGQVQPEQITFLDVIEGGVIKDVLSETGQTVRKGDTLLTLSNSDLQLSVLQRESAIYDQINNVRNSRLALEQNSLDLKQQLENARYQKAVLTPEFERQEQLFEQKLISAQEWEQTREQYEYQNKQYALTYESYKKDSAEAYTQLQQLERSEERMFESLKAIQSILDNLTIKAPVGGQLITNELNRGQSLQQGERIGQIDGLSGFKVQVLLDEIRLSDIERGMKAYTMIEGSEYELSIVKIYPVINEGRFRVDLSFNGADPENLRRGQNLTLQILLSAAGESLLLERGAYYRKTGGKWIYKVREDGGGAVRKKIQTGRANPEYFEIYSGLRSGDRVIISDYDAFGENRTLIFK